MSEDEAKDALKQFVDSQCCYGTDPIKNMQFTDLQSSNTYRVWLKNSSLKRLKIQKLIVCFEYIHGIQVYKVGLKTVYR